MGRLTSSEESRNKHGWMKNHMFTVKVVSLMVLSIQTSTTVLLLRYSRTGQQKQYIISTAVLIAEIFKMMIALGFLHLECGCVLIRCRDRFYKDVFGNFFDTLKVSVPAFLYVVQNNLLYFALTNLDAATYQVTYQLKILTTAIFSWIMLGKRLGYLHWLSLCCLMIGVSLVQVDAGLSTTNPDKKLSRIPNEELSLDDVLQNDNAHHFDHPNVEVSWLLGVLAVFVSCLSSGFSGVYFEKLVKHGRQASLVIRNIQLGMFSILFAILAVMTDGSSIRDGGFFQGYSIVTWAVILIQAFGGLVVSVTVKYADNILKGFATSLSIVMNTMVSWLILGDAAPTTQFIIGASIVISATVIYGISPHPNLSSNGSPDKVSLVKKRQSDIV